MKKIKQKGIDVTIAAAETWGSLYDPKKMYDANGIIKANIQPYYSNRTVKGYDYLMV